MPLCLTDIDKYDKEEKEIETKEMGLFRGFIEFTKLIGIKKTFKFFKDFFSPNFSKEVDEELKKAKQEIKEAYEKGEPITIRKWKANMIDEDTSEIRLDEEETIIKHKKKKSKEK